VTFTGRRKVLARRQGDQRTVREDYNAGIELLGEKYGEGFVEEFTEDFLETTFYRG
jgi:hypothetical protein